MGALPAVAALPLLAAHLLEVLSGLTIGIIFVEVPVVKAPVCPVRLDFSVLDWEIFFINDG